VSFRFANRLAEALCAKPRGGLAAFLLLASISSADTAQAQEQGDSVVLQGGGGEVYIGGLPPGWTAAARIEGMPVDFAAWTPKGQTGSDWREMIAAQLFPGLGGRDPGAFLDRVVSSYDQACASISTTSIKLESINGLPAAFRAVACSRNNGSGFGEVVLLRVISGKKALYLMERIYRTEPFAKGSIPLDNDRLAEGKKSLELGLACQHPPGKVTTAAGSPCPEGWKPALESLLDGQAVTVFRVDE
jgi:hypothetical protein